MIGFYILHLLARGIYHLLFILLQARIALIAISKECRSGSIFLLKAQCVYIITALVFIISALSDEFASLSVTSYDEKDTRNITGSSALDVEVDSYSYNNGVLGLVMEHSLHGGVFNYSNA